MNANVESRVVSQRDPKISGEFDRQSLETALNAYSAH